MLRTKSEKQSQSESFLGINQRNENLIEDGKNSMLMDWKDHCYEYDYIAKINLQTQCNPYQYPCDYLHRNRETINLTIHLEA